MKRFVMLALVFVFVMSLLGACAPAPAAAPAEAAKPAEAATPAEAAKPAEEAKPATSSSEGSAERTYKLPTTGIGTLIATDVKAAKPFKIGVIVKNTTNPYMVGIVNGAKKAGADMGFEVLDQAPAKQDSVEDQVRLMEDMIQAGVNGMILLPVDSNGIMPGVRKAKEANVPLVVIGTPAAEETFLRTGVDYYETGVVIAEEVAKKMEGKGNIIILEGPSGAQNARERLQGINDALKKFPDITIQASQTTNFKRVEGMQVMENLLQRFKDVNAVIGMNDESAIGGLQAIKAAGLEGKVIVAGFDGNKDASTLLKEGGMLVSYNTDPFGSTYLGCVYLVQFLNDGTKPPQYFVPFPAKADGPLITNDNVDKYNADIAWWK